MKKSEINFSTLHPKVCVCAYAKLHLFRYVTILQFYKYLVMPYLHNLEICGLKLIVSSLFEILGWCIDF
jgi:hypothetical protein